MSGTTRDYKPGQKPLPHPCLFACAHFPCEVGLWGLAQPGASTNEGPGLGRPPLLVGLGSRRSPSRRAVPSSSRAPRPPRGSPNGAVSPRPVRPGGNQGPLTSAALSMPSRAPRGQSRPGPAPAASHPLGPAICRLAPSSWWESCELRRVRTLGPWEIRPATPDVTDHSALDWLLRGSEQLPLPPVVAGCLLGAGAPTSS